MKPDLQTFREAVIKYNGNISKVAEAFGVWRSAVYTWMCDDEQFQAVVDDARMKMFDRCLATADIVANGIPDIQNGKVVGWVERPDGNMLRYLLGTLGKKEGFGESIDITTNGKDINSLFRVLTKDELATADEQFEKDY